MIMLNLRENKAILRPNTGNLLKHSNNITTKSVNKEKITNFDDKFISKVINDLSYSTNNENDYYTGKQNSRPSTSVVYRSRSKLVSPRKQIDTEENGYETFRSCDSNNLGRNRRSRISKSHKNILKNEDSIIKQSITYYNDFMEGKTRACKELRKKISRAHMPGYELKPEKKIWETSWK